MATFAIRLQMAMEKAEIRAADLSRITGISKSTLSRYLSGSYLPKQNNTYLLAKALNVSPIWLFTGMNVSGDDLSFVTLKEKPSDDPVPLDDIIHNAEFIKFDNQLYALDTYQRELLISLIRAVISKKEK